MCREHNVDELLCELFEEDDPPYPPPPIAGLDVFPGFLSRQHQTYLIQQVRSGWFSGGNQAMVFGVDNMPPWLQQLAAQLPLRVWPAELRQRVPLFDTAILNLYEPGDGITPHVDLLRFSDGIAVVSLGDAAIMDWTPVQQPDQQPQQQQQQQQPDQQQPHQEPALQDGHGCPAPPPSATATTSLPAATSAAPAASVPNRNKMCSAPQRCQDIRAGIAAGSQLLSSRAQQHQQQPQHQLLLKGGDVLLMRGEARYGWRHGIAGVTHELLLCGACRGAGAAATSCSACVRMARGRRVSITLRRLNPDDVTLSVAG